jgi:hypothetical protein
MSENDICFICLDESNNRICNECKCFAHPRCFAEYLNKNLRLDSLIEEFVDVTTFSIFTYIGCPICKKEIVKHNKRITRRDTYDHRFNYVVYMLNYYLTIINTDETDLNMIHDLMDDMFKVVVKYKSTILKNDKFNKLIKNKLEKMKEDWPKANLYHYEIYGTQIQ